MLWTRRHGLCLMPTPRNASLFRVSQRQCHPWGLMRCWPAVDGKWSPILRFGHEARLHSSLSHDVESFDVRCGSSGFILYRVGSLPVVL